MKCIVLARVSTEGQSFEQQAKELVEAATKDHYKKRDIIVIENKESAIKNDEEHRLGLIEMKEAVAADPTINCVYVREVSRIGRTYKVLNSIKGWFVSNKIQLVMCGTTRIELLDKEGNITIEGGVMFEIACQSAIREMEDKKLRFKQGVKKAWAEGKAGQSNVKYGYKIVNKYITINENEAEVVRYIFDQYANTGKSTMALYRELVAGGTFARLSSDYTGANKIRVIISNYAYSGRNQLNKKHNEMKYEAIVSEDIQDRAITKLHKMKQQPKYITKFVYYAKSLVRCTCGHIMQAEISTMCYWCPSCGKRHSINHLDWLAWNSAAQLKLTADTSNQRETEKRCIEDIAANDNKIKVMNKRLEEFEDLEEEIAEASLSITNKERREKFRERKLRAVNMERKQVEKSLLKIKEQTRQMKQYLQSLQAPVTDGTGIVPVLEITDDEKRKEIITQCIDEIKLETIDDKHVHITIIPKASIAHQYWYDYVYDRTKKNFPITLEHYIKTDSYEDITKYVVAGRRLTKKYVKQRTQESKANARAHAL